MSYVNEKLYLTEPWQLICPKFKYSRNPVLTNKRFQLLTRVWTETRARISKASKSIPYDEIYKLPNNKNNIVKVSVPYHKSKLFTNMRIS